MVDFRAQVLERSHQVPVVVDFWAAWCGPCRMLGPVIEQLAAEAEGRWELVKLDTEQQPDVAQTYGILSIPAVKMFRDGREVAEFVGALPEQQIRAWLDQNLPDPGRERLAAVLDRWRDRGAASVVDELETLAAEQPDSLATRLRLAQALVARDPQRARSLAHAATSGASAEEQELAQDVAHLAELIETEEGVPRRLASHVEGARTALRRDDLDTALEHLVELAMLDKRFRNELPRRAAVALFRLLGQDHDLTRKHQRRLGMALHS